MLDDASDTVRVADVVAEMGVRDARVIRSDTRAGVGGGRNLLFAAATGDVLFVLDDDAYLEDPLCLTRLRDTMRAQPQAGILAARIVNHPAEAPTVLAPIPWRTRRRFPQAVEQSQPVSYFLGGAHAVRRVVYETIGGYAEGFVFGEEELDLSYRAIQAGFGIWYAHDIVVHHEPMAPVVETRGQPESEIFYHTRNRIVIAWTYLPIRYRAPYLAIWMGRNAMRAVSSGRVRDLIKGIHSGLKAARASKPHRLSGPTLDYLRNHHGRLWY